MLAHLLSLLSLLSVALCRQSGNRNSNSWLADVDSAISVLQMRDKNRALTSLPAASESNAFGLRSFDSMKNPKLRDMAHGFPGAAYGSGLLPRLFWFARVTGSYCVSTDQIRRDCRVTLFYGSCHRLFIEHRYNLFLMEIQWERLIAGCDELNRPRCSWQKFLSFLDPLAMDHLGLLDAGIIASRWNDSSSTRMKGPTYYLPYRDHGCYPIHDIDTLSALYIHALCTAHKDSLLQATPRSRRLWSMRSLCPNPCRRNPCSSIPQATGGCRVTGFNTDSFTCECRHNFRFNEETGRCVPTSTCDRCHKDGTIACQWDPVTGVSNCVCSQKYMGPMCNQVNNPCENGAHHPALLPGNDACRVGLSKQNRCHPHNGSSHYACTCGAEFQVNKDLPYSNCQRPASICSRRVCLYGTCVFSPDMSVTACQCEHGFKGEQCEQLQGVWSQWSAWSDCSPACAHAFGDVTRRRHRVCHGDPADCRGPQFDSVICADSPACQTQLTPEAEALREMRLWWTKFFNATVTFSCIAAACLLALKVLTLLLPTVLDLWSRVTRFQPTMLVEVDDEEFQEAAAESSAQTG